MKTITNISNQSIEISLRLRPLLLLRPGASVNCGDYEVIGLVDLRTMEQLSITFTPDNPPPKFEMLRWEVILPEDTE